MKNLGIIATLIYIIGIIMGLYLKISIVFLLCFIFIISIIFLFPRVNKKIMLIFTIIILLSSVYSKYRCNLFEQKYKDIDDLKLIGKIVNVESKNDYIITYKVKVKKLNNLMNFNGTNIIIKVKKNNKMNFKLGDIIQVDGNVKPPDVKRNYNGFDYRRYLNSKDIYTVVEAKNINILKENNIFSILYIKNIIINKVESTLIEKNSGI